MILGTLHMFIAHFDILLEVPIQVFCLYLN